MTPEERRAEAEAVVTKAMVEWNSDPLINDVFAALTPHIVSALENAEAAAVREYQEASYALCGRIPTLEGNMDASLGDWIIKGVKGEFFPCKPDIFEATYEPE
jgi:hypothetical protein